MRAVFNGEIYNFAELRRDLIARGHRIAHQRRHRADRPPLRAVRRRLRRAPAGDVRHRPVGRAPPPARARPRPHGRQAAVLGARRATASRFASEVKSLIAGGLIEAQLDPLAAELFLAHGFVPGPRTLFAGVNKLPPGVASSSGRTAAWSTSTPTGTRTSTATSGRTRASPRTTEQLLELLREAIDMRMVADVPLGVMLSGGLDSSLITAIMAERSSRPVQTFSIAFAEDGGSNELGDALRVAERLGTDHHALTTSAVDHPALLDEALWHMEEPVADVSCLGFLLLSRLARETRHRGPLGPGRRRAARRLPQARDRRTRRQLSTARRPSCGARRQLPLGPRRRARRSRAGSQPCTTDDPVERLLAMSRVVQSHERAELLEPGVHAPRRRGRDRRRGPAPAARACPAARSARRCTSTRALALVDNMLLYFDKMSMATSLEVRVPFMDHELVEFCTRLPDSRRVYHGRRKEILKRASRGLVEDAIIDKPKRGFFHSALGAWLGVHRDALVRETLLDGRALARGQYRADAVERPDPRGGRRGGQEEQPAPVLPAAARALAAALRRRRGARAVRRRAARPRLLTPWTAAPDLSVVVVTHNGRDLAVLDAARRARAARRDQRASGSSSTAARPTARPTRSRPRSRTSRCCGCPTSASPPATTPCCPRARGRHVLLLNPDMEITDGTLADLVAAMDARPEVGASSVIQVWPEGGVAADDPSLPLPGRQLSEALMLPRLPGLRAVQEEEQRLRRLRRGGRPATGSSAGSCACAAAAIEQVGGLDERFFLFSEEADWCLRLREGGWDIRHLPLMTATHHTGPLRAAGPVRPELVLQAALRAQALPRAGAARLPLRARPAPCRAARAARPPDRPAARPAQHGPARSAVRLSVVLGLDAPPFSPVP